jgi:hypothetical protein
MFYARINKIKVFNNREGFLGLFNRAEMRIYSYVAATFAPAVPTVPNVPSLPTVADLLAFTADQRRERLLEAVLSESGRFAQSYSLAIDRVRDNQSLTFGEAGILVYQGDGIPDALDMQLLVIEADEDIRTFAIEADRGLTQATPPEEIRRRKIAHETAIPTGIYWVTVNLSPSKRRKLPRLLDVPGFSGILIHRGNTKNDSSGCILVGENKVRGKVIHSTQYEKRLVALLTDAQERGEETSIEITNHRAP